MTRPHAQDHGWSFVTNHARALGCIAADPTVRLRDIAATLGITERTAAHVVMQLEQAGYIAKTRRGRRNHYTVDRANKLQHPRLQTLAGGQLVTLLLEVFDRQPFS